MDDARSPQPAGYTDDEARQINASIRARLREDKAEAFEEMKSLQHACGALDNNYCDYCSGAIKIVHDWLTKRDGRLEDSHVV